MAEPALKMTVDELRAFLAREFPQAAPMVVLEEIAPMTARMRLLRDERHLRPGGTISGPSMALLADVTFYAAVLGMIGPQALTVTTSMAFNFMRKPADADLICAARILKLGRRLAVGDAVMFSAGTDPDAPAAHATLTYAIPEGSR